MKKDEVMTVKEYQDKQCSTQKAIDKVHFNKLPDYDLKASDWQYIRRTYNADLWDMMYAAYKLGFSRGMKKAESEKK